MTKAHASSVSPPKSVSRWIRTPPGWPFSASEPTPVKQLVLDEETREAARAGADQIAVELSLESLNVLCDVTLDQRGVPFEWTAER